MKRVARIQPNIPCTTKSTFYGFVSVILQAEDEKEKRERII
jgi:hypothetical protein